MENVLRGCNLYCDGINKWLVLDEIQLPSLEDEVVDYRPGGGSFE